MGRTGKGGTSGLGTWQTLRGTGEGGVGAPGPMPGATKPTSGASGQPDTWVRRTLLFCGTASTGNTPEMTLHVIGKGRFAATTVLGASAATGWRGEHVPCTTTRSRNSGTTGRTRFPAWVPVKARASFAKFLRTGNTSKVQQLLLKELRHGTGQRPRVCSFLSRCPALGSKTPLTVAVLMVTLLVEAEERGDRVNQKSALSAFASVHTTVEDRGENPNILAKLAPPFGGPHETVLGILH